MDDLVKLVGDKVGISPEQAQQAVHTVVGFLKDKLPAGLGGQVEGLLSGKTDVSGLAGQLGGLFGGDKK